MRAPETVEPDHDEPAPHAQHFLWFQALPSWLVSGVVHFVLLLVLAIITIAPPVVSAHVQMSAALPEPDDELVDEFDEKKLELKVDDATLSEPTTEVLQAGAAESENLDAPALTVEAESAPPAIELDPLGETTALHKDLLAIPGNGLSDGSGFNSRKGRDKPGRALEPGATRESEAAVAAALAWLASHQLPDGSWNYDHRIGPCNARCGNAGSLTDCRTGATAQALLPFLGAGQTHKEGKYKQQVQAGLYFLTQQMKVKPQLGLQCGDLAQGGGNMYSHGMAAIVLCEAYGMTQDRGLMLPAQLSLNHIVYAQDPVGGGWRYAPRTPGDTSVVGWQLMALKSGHLAYLHVPPETIGGANKFLDSVMSDYSYYGYTDPGRGQATTAIGLLCRMYLGWKKDHPGIEKGIQYLSQTGPSKGNMYYNYYATQCLRHYDGELWDKWNVQMRDQLVNSQEKVGHLKGSWHMNGDHGSDRGGRLYCTSMATMILEVYYRHAPLYGKGAVEAEFFVKR
jgi:hypothetical protein